MNSLPLTKNIRLSADVQPSMRWDGVTSLEEHRVKCTERLRDLLGMDYFTPCEPVFEVLSDDEHLGHRHIRFSLQTEEDYFTYCDLLLPKEQTGKLPLCACLQGHSKGSHISLGIAKYPGDEEIMHGGDRDFCLRAVEEGFAALAIEQRAFGQCGGTVHGPACERPAMTSLLLGRTLIGERAWDVSRAVDMLETIPEIDSEHIALMGLSGGGTATYYAGAMEPRIKVVMPAGAVCSFDESIGVIRHCVCNYIPRMAKYFDMGEIACMIAPRPLIVVTGDKDPIFRVEGVRKVYSVIEEIYQKEGAPNNCKLIVGDGEHRFFKHLAWEPFREYFIG